MTTPTFNLHSVRQKMQSYSSTWQMYVLLLLFLVGMTVGSFASKGDGTLVTNKIADFYMNYLKVKPTISGLSVFFNTFLLASSAIIVTYFIGLCAVGIPFVAFVPVLAGGFIGIISGYIYENYMLKGLGYCAIIIFPAAIIAVAAILFACKESFLMSVTMLNLLSQRRSQPLESFKNYSLRFVIYIAITAAGALTETIMTRLFIGLFAF